MKHMRTEQKLKAVFVFLALLNDIAQSRKPSWGTILWRHWANSWKLLIWRKHSRLSLGKSIIFPWVFPEDTSLQLRYLVSVSLTHLSYLFVFSLLFANCFDPSIKRKPSLVSHVISLLHTPCLSVLWLSASPVSLCLAGFGSWLTVSLLEPLLSSFLINGLFVYVILLVNWLLSPVIWT